MSKQPLPTSLSFDLALQQIPVTLKDPQTGVLGTFVIREMTGRQRDAYLNGVSKRTRQMPDGSTRVVNFEGLQGDLLSRCMYRTGTGDDTLVTLADVQGWPAKVQSELFEVARNLSGLAKEEGEDDEDGNDEGNE